MKFFTKSLLQGICLLTLALVVACGKGEQKAPEKKKEVPPTVQVAPVEEAQPTPERLHRPPLRVDAQPGEVGPVDGDWLRLLLSGSPNTLSPLLSSSLAEQQVGTFIFDDAVHWDCWQQPTPFIYLDWKMAEDKRTFHIPLSKNSKWQDGHPVTADDFIFFYEKGMDPNVPALTFKDSLDRIESIQKINDYEMEIRLKQALATYIYDITLSPIPKHILKDETDFTNSPYNRNPVGNGPYKLASWVTDQSIELERWEDYPGEKPHFKKVIFKIIPETAVGFNAFLKEEVDVTTLSVEQLTKQTDTPEFKKVGRVLTRSSAGYTYIGWNMDGSNPFFADKQVRIAMAHAMDLEKIKKKIMYDLYEICTGIFHPDQYAYNPDVQPLKYDLKKAKEMLEAAGWKDTNKDGVLDKNGQSFAFELKIPQGNDVGEKIAVVYQQSLKKIGVAMTVRKLEWATFLTQVQKHEFQAEMAGWGAGFDPDTSSNLWTSKMYTEGRNYGKYSNPEVDKLFDEGRVEFDVAKREQVYQKMMQIIYDDQPYLFMFYSNYQAGFHKRLRGIEVCLYGAFRHNPGPMAWWVPAPLQMYK